MEKEKKISLQNAIKLINETNSELSNEIIEKLERFYEVSGEIILYPKNTDLQNLLVGNDIIIINGDLNVVELLKDCDKVDSSLLIILGNTNCENFITLSSIYITGNLNVENVILGDSLCNNTLSVGGNIKTKTILDYGHSIIAHKKIAAKNIFSFNSIEDMNGTVDNSMTSDELIDEITDVDNGERLENLSKTIQYIKNGGKIFKK